MPRPDKIWADREYIQFKARMTLEEALEELDSAAEEWDQTSSPAAEERLNAAKRRVKMLLRIGR